MLHIVFGRLPEAVFNTAVYFKNSYEDSWITDDFAKRAILDVDKSVVLGNGVIDSPVLGKIAPNSLSGGVKTLILIKNEPERIFNASTCGDNCAKWLLEIGRLQDITINLRHIMDFGSAPQDTTLRQTLEKEVELFGPQYLYRKLEEVDPAAAARIHPNNVKKVIRALEFFRETGKSLAVHNEEQRKKESGPG